VAELLSVNVGMPRDISWNGVTVHTGAWKYLARGARMVHRHGVEGDGQGDLAGHGGPNRVATFTTRYSRAPYSRRRRLAETSCWRVAVSPSCSSRPVSG
jgi:MOSC domain-containing protein YiiM